MVDDQGLEETVKLETQPSPKFLEALLVDGRHVPNSREFAELLAKINLKTAFSNSRVEPKTKQGLLALSFDTLEQARLMVMAVGARGSAEELFTYMPSQREFDPTPIVSMRIDGNQFTASETTKGERVELSLRALSEIYRPEQLQQFTGIVKELVLSEAPHLADEVKNFSF